MIIFFSGTGNSKFVAEKIADKTEDVIVSLNEKIKAGDNSPVDVNGRLVFVFPTYAWRIPRIAEDWIMKTKIKNADKVWFVMTCGGETGNAGEYNRKLCMRKSFEYMGTMQIVMPENYIAMFDVPGSEEAQKIISDALPAIKNTAGLIADGKCFPEPERKPLYTLESAVVNPMFYSLCVKAGPFHAEKGCISCGRCVDICPLNNVRLYNGKPGWGKNCTHCMACISFCPVSAVEYGKKSVGKNRYRYFYKKH